MYLKKVVVMLISLVGAIYIPNGLANNFTCKENLAVQSHCDLQSLWYVGGDLGVATTDTSIAKLDDSFIQSTLTADIYDIEDSDTAYSIFTGYQLLSYLAIEIGYLNLGSRSIAFTGEAIDEVDFYHSAKHIYPQSGSGMTLSAALSLPLTDKFKVSVKLGYFNWRGEYITSDYDKNVGFDNTTGHDFFYGGEINYRIRDKLQVYLSGQMFKLKDDKTHYLAVGFRYYFNH